MGKKFRPKKAINLPTYLRNLLITITLLLVRRDKRPVDVMCEDTCQKIGRAVSGSLKRHWISDLESFRECDYIHVFRETKNKNNSCAMSFKNNLHK